MKAEKIDVFKIELEGKEATDFKAALQKVIDENNRAGFQQNMTADEKKIVKDIHEKL